MFSKKEWWVGKLNVIGTHISLKKVQYNSEILK